MRPDVKQEIALLGTCFCALLKLDPPAVLANRLANEAALKQFSIHPFDQSVNVKIRFLLIFFLL